MPGLPPPPSPLLPPRSRRVHPLRWPLIVLTFPFSLALFLFQSLFGWMGTHYLGPQRRLFQLGIIVAVFWVALGQLTMWFDPNSAKLSEKPYLYSSYQQPGADLWSRPYIRFNPSDSCSEVVRQRNEIGFGQRPFGKPFLFLSSCSAVVGREMLSFSGFRGAAHWWDSLAERTLNDWMFNGRMSWPFFLLGAGAYIEIVLVIPWCVLIVVSKVLGHLRWS